MLKRVQKRQKRRQEEEELGLDEEMKEIMGLQDTDSDESNSDTEHSENGSEAAQDDSQDGRDDESLANFAGDDESDEDEDLEEADSITVPEALTEPIYIVSVQPTVKACILCPGKVLKDKMVEVHRSSNAHTRRFKQFEKLAKDAHPGQSAAMLVRTAFQEKPTTVMQSDGNSKRAAKREARLAKFKDMRAKKKAKGEARATAQKEATEKPPSPVDALEKSASKPQKKRGNMEVFEEPEVSSKTPKKKRKAKDSAIPETKPSPKRMRVEADTETKPKSDAKPKERSVAVSVKDIARSASDRARKALERKRA